MKYTAAAVAAFAAGASAALSGGGGSSGSDSYGGYVPASNVTYTTITTTALTTVCPSATEIVQGSKTYTVTEVRIHPSFYSSPKSIASTDLHHMSVDE